MIIYLYSVVTEINYENMGIICGDSMRMHQIGELPEPDTSK